MRKENLLAGLSQEQIIKVKTARNTKEVLDIAKNEGIELTEEQLETVSGGLCTHTGPECPFCGSKNTRYWSTFNETYKCKDCEEIF